MKDSYNQIMRERRERRQAAVFTHRGWYVTPSEDGQFDVCESEGDCMDTRKTLALATKECIKGADEAYRCTLRDTILDIDLDSHDTATLRAILVLLGKNPDAEIRP